MFTGYVLENKVAIVTGAGSGIGHALARLLLEAGCSAVFADIKLRPEAEQTLEAYHETKSRPGCPTALFQSTDVSNWADLQSLWDTTLQRFGHIDIVISVAGIYEPPSSSFWRPPGVSPMSCDSASASLGQYKTFAVNQVAPIRLAQIAIDYWTQHRNISGNYLAVASVAAYLHSIETPLYMASKAALVSFVKSLGPVQDILGTRMSVVCPGPVLTPIFEPEWNRKLTYDDISLSPEECASVLLRVLREPQWGNGSVVETYKKISNEAPEIVVRDVSLEILYPIGLGKPSQRVIESREALVDQIREKGMRFS